MRQEPGYVGESQSGNSGDDLKSLSPNGKYQISKIESDASRNKTKIRNITLDL